VPRDVITSRPIVVGEIVEVLPADQLPSRPIRTMAASCAERRFAETIDQRTVTLTDTDCGGAHYTAALWRDHAVRFHGEAPTVSAAQLQLQVYRSLRSLPRPAP